MRSCLRVPRLFLPADHAHWASPPAGEENGCEGGGASALLLPDRFRGGEEEEAKREEVRENMYAALENGTLLRFGRGVLIVKRETKYGLRRGILACLDLEEAGDAVCFTTDRDEALVLSYAKERERAPLELPHTLLCYKDKRGKLMRTIESEVPEPIYNVDLPWGKLSAEVLPPYLEGEVLHALVRLADPGFGVLDGNHTLAADKLHWERVKKSISAQEARNHPARFALAEFVDFSDPAVVFEQREGGCAEKSDILALWKKGKTLPAKSVGAGGQFRLCMECREISYD